MGCDLYADQRRGLTTALQQSPWPGRGELPWLTNKPKVTPNTGTPTISAVIPANTLLRFRRRTRRSSSQASGSSDCSRDDVKEGMDPPNDYTTRPSLEPGASLRHSFQGRRAAIYRP